MNLSLEEHIILTNGVLLESPYMLQRFLKRLGYGWKRFRKSLKKEQDEQQYRRKLAELKDLIKLNQQGYIDFFLQTKYYGLSKLRFCTQHNTQSKKH